MEKYFINKFLRFYKFIIEIQNNLRIGPLRLIVLCGKDFKEVNIHHG